MSRKTHTSAVVSAGCVTCVGQRLKPLWTSRNALALAARHHDRTGHQTWAEQVLSVTYGDAEDDSAQPGLFPDREADRG